MSLQQVLHSLAYHIVSTYEVKGGCVKCVLALLDLKLPVIQALNRSRLNSVNHLQRVSCKLCTHVRKLCTHVSKLCTHVHMSLQSKRLTSTGFAYRSLRGTGCSSLYTKHSLILKETESQAKRFPQIQVIDSCALVRRKSASSSCYS